ncbi:MAG: hypothetical protein HGB00_07260 [Chlorobiaceae bacterium]|nr:hypothetical protein [Chlorobiaceae bacterium]
MLYFNRPEDSGINLFFSLGNLGKQNASVPEHLLCINQRVNRGYFPFNSKIFLPFPGTTGSTMN